MDDFVFLPYIRKLILAAKESGGAPLDKLNPQEARRLRGAFFKTLLGQTRSLPDVRDLVMDLDGRPTSCRLYKPNLEQNLPVLVYFHGGGWMVGSVESHDNLCRKLSLASGCAIVSVDYRLAPENKFPAAAEDAYLSVKWVAEKATELGLDRNRLAVGGDSSGGNLAAVVCLMARDHEGPAIKHQLLVYPVTDVSRFDSPSYRTYSDKLILTTDGMKFFVDQYLDSAEQAIDPRVSPALAGDFSNLPPAVVLTAEHDVLTSDGEEYAGLLAKAGVKVEYACLPGTIHLFFGMEELDPGQNGLDLAAKAIGVALAR